MNVVKRLSRRQAIILLILASLVLAACGGRGVETTWPGMTADDQGVVYVAYGPAVIAVDVETNEQLWSYPQGEGSAAPIYAAPTASEGKVVFGDFGASGGVFSPQKKVSFYSLDASDGSLMKEVVSEETQDRIVAPALLVGDRIFFGTADNKVIALDAETLEPVWPEPFEAEHSIWGMPAYNDGVVYVPSLDRNVYALDASSGSVIWQANVGGSVSDKAIKNSELVYVGSFDKHVYALDSQSGETRWSAQAQDAVWGAPLYVDGVVYFADLGGNLFAVDGETGESIWSGPELESAGSTYEAAGYVVAQPAYADGRLFIASGGDPDQKPAEREGELFAYDAEDGSFLWKSSADAPLFTSPVIVSDKVVVAQEAQTLLAYFTLEGARTGGFTRPGAE